ncbi:uncharacterized protein LOC105699590 [Orussus abietinus]|uniref:uncharacterized protein LOC105699590 n=1 Tax=Orussus abietinus TaxID=222816 RepID=UPI0006256FA2|nr:uncharacterized protein LOC105699590 [Orussus abietinus]
MPWPSLLSDAYKTVYYDPHSGKTLTGKVESTKLSGSRITFRGLPCDCDGLSCGCCAGVNLTSFNFDRRACSNFTFVPSDLAIEMSLSVDDRRVVETSLSARNPPPLCIPVPYLPVVSLCFKFYDVHVSEDSVHACLDLQTEVIRAPVLILHFDCLRIGRDGVAWVKPGEDGGSQKPGPDGNEVYDDVDFEPQDQESISILSSTPPPSPEEEAAIGQLKL